MQTCELEVPFDQCYFLLKWPSPVFVLVFKGPC
uniref:Uncharacterized protein n=1 Tax=Anguilla anguilla TaxID=7936 RepID=A0A0E9W9I8_ANGAN